MNRRDLVVAGVLALGAFAVYVVTLAPDVLPGDSGEFQLAVPLLGIVHPTGYPLYLLLGRLFTLLPVASIAYRVNLFSAASAALAVGAFYLVALGMVEAITNRRSGAHYRQLVANRPWQQPVIPSHSGLSPPPYRSPWHSRPLSGRRRRWPRYMRSTPSL